MTRRQPGRHEMPDVAEVHQDGSTSVDHTAIDLANTAPSHSSGSVQVLPEIGKIALVRYRLDYSLTWH